MHCLIYPFMKNGTLDEYLKKKENPLTSRQRLNILLGVANAIDYIHSQNQTENDRIKVLVHRDIKPANILLDDDLEPKVKKFRHFILIEAVVL